MRNYNISKKKDELWTCEVTDSYGITHVNYFETELKASKWVYYIWENEDEFHKEAIKLTRELNFFDVLRTDRTTAAFGLEVRVPFLDAHFVKFSLSIPPNYKRSNNRILLLFF